MLSKFIWNLFTIDPDFRGVDISKMSTGKDMGMEGQKIEINKETGEVTMKFKLPI